MYHNRFDVNFPLQDLYEEIRTALGAEIAVGETVPVKDLMLDLPNNQLRVRGEVRALGERARSVLCERLGLGRIFEVLSTDTLVAASADINMHLLNSGGSLILKSRGNEVQGIVSDRYQETPYLDIIDMFEHLGARPVRLYQNDYNLRMQAIFNDYAVTPKDGEDLNLGVQMQTSDMGVGALKFEIFTYRWICDNGCIMGKQAAGSFRTIHMKNMEQAEHDIDEQVKKVLRQAQDRITVMANLAIATKFDQQKVVDFLGQQAIGKKALALLASRIAAATPRNMWDVINVLTEAGHSPDFSQSVQHTLENAAGQLMDLVAA